MPDETPQAPRAFDPGLGVWTSEAEWRRVSNSWFRLDAIVPTFKVADRQTGEILLVDDRVFDPDRHERL